MADCGSESHQRHDCSQQYDETEHEKCVGFHSKWSLYSLSTVFCTVRSCESSDSMIHHLLTRNRWKIISRLSSRIIYVPLLKTNEYQYPLQLDGWVRWLPSPFSGFSVDFSPIFFFFFFWGGGWTKTGKAMVKPWVNLITSLCCWCSEETDLSSSNGFRHCRWQSQITSWRIRRYTFA